MPSFATLPRHGRTFVKLCLGAWLLLLAAGVANACNWQGDLGDDGGTVMASAAAFDHDGDTLPPGCEDARGDQIAVIAKLQVVQDQPAGPALLASPATVMAPPTPAGVFLAAVERRPPPGVPVPILLLRLHL